MASAAALDPHTPLTPTSTPNPTCQPAPAPMGALGDHIAKVQGADIPQTASASTLKTSGTPLSEHPGADTVAPATSASRVLEGTTTQRAIRNKLYVLQAHIHQVVEAHATFPAWSLHVHCPPKAPTCAAPQPCHPRPGLVHELEQYAASVAYAHIGGASHSLDAADHVQSSGPKLTYTYVADNLHTDAQPASPLDPDLSAALPDTWVESPRSSATPPSPHTPLQLYEGTMATHESTAGIGHLSTACQGFCGANHCLPSSPSSTTTPTLAPEYLKTMQQTSSRYAPTTTDNHFSSIVCHSAGDQDLCNVRQMAKVMYPPHGGEHSMVCSAPSVGSPNFDRERSADIGAAVNGTYPYDEDVLVQDQHIGNATTYPRQQGSYSELLQALRNPAPTPIKPPSVTNPATASLSTIPPEAHADLYTHSHNSALRLYPQDLLIDHAQPSYNTHLWSQSAHARPYFYAHISLASASMMTAQSYNLTHIDSQCSGIRYGYLAPS